MSRHAHEAENNARVRVFVVTCSDTRTLESDESGRLAEELFVQAGHRCAGRLVVRDEPAEILRVLQGPVRDADVQAVLVNGGTGLSRRDRTYDALAGLLEKRLDGFGELFRMLSYQQIGPAAMLSRAVAGLWEERVVFSVPGSRNAVRLAMEKLVLPELGHMVRETTK